MKKIVLGIETSCDDTSLAILEGEGGKVPRLLSHRSFTQELLLRKWGGVVPEIAARNHVEKLVPLLHEVFHEAKKEPADLDLIGVTTHPGLLGPLLTGLNAAKTLALIHKTPVLAVNHLYAHLEAIHLSHEVPYPYLGLLVSGGHGLFFLVHSPQDFEKLGTTMDDAPGEAFDKGGKLLGLPYPAGRIIDDLAKKGNRQRFSFPIGLKDKKTPDMSFSGVKTALKVFLQQWNGEKLSVDSQDFWDICASYQESIVAALSLKMKWALLEARRICPDIHFPIVVGGGVACNSRLRQKLGEDWGQGKEEHPLYFVAPAFCTDNGAMIANYAFRNASLSTPYPQCLNLDAYGKFLSPGQ